MRQIQNLQMEIGEIDPRFIRFDPKARDKLTLTLRGLQHIYSDDWARESILAKLDSLVCDNGRGRQGMNLWTIFVLGVVRLACDFDYDMLSNMANNHRDLQKMIGIGAAQQ
jgi:hypothetical protein